MPLAYLSIDLDYGNENIEQLLAILKYAKSLNVSTIIVDSHEDLLEHISTTKFITLINVDEHSDLYKYEPLNHMSLNCGNWVNFASDYASDYVWIRPTLGETGRCDTLACQFEKLESDYDKVWTTHKNWRKIFNSHEIVAVGVALSAMGRYTNQRTVDGIVKDKMLVEWFTKIKRGSVEYLRGEFLLDNFMNEEEEED